MTDFNQQKAKIKEAYNIVDLVEQENVSLSVSGPGEYKGLCPFHNEKTPSFKVSEPFQNYYCFGCGASGDIFTFIQETRGCSFPEAMLYLAESKGIEVDFGTKGRTDTGPKIDLKKMYSLVKDANTFYRNEFEKLDNSHPAKKEILKRGLDVENEVFGYAPERYGALYNHLKEKGYSDELMVQSELIGQKDGKYFDFFYGRLTITLADFSGRPVSYSARKLFDKDSRAKYVNGKASPVFQKKATLFNLHNAKKTARLEGNLILSEGPFDVLAIEKAGFTNAVASCGTAFTEEHLKAARQLVGENGQLTFAFDGDSAGIEAAMKIFIHFPIAHSVSKIALFPEGMDPCDYLQKEGPDKVKEIIENATPITDFVLQEVANHVQLTDMSSRYKFIKILVSTYFSKMTDDVLLEYMMRKASVISGVEIQKIRDLQDDFKKNNHKRALKEQKHEQEELNMKIELNSFDDSDVCYVNAFSMLIKDPLELIPLTKGVPIPDKFKEFLRELVNNVKRYKAQNKPYRFIAEEYSDVDFAKYLQNVSNNALSHSSMDELKAHYELVLESGVKFYESNVRQAKIASIKAALAEAKSNDEVLEMLKLLEEHQ